ncbi:uncharacterized protein LOC117928385 [Vitis riparia]|uniref:uncharacterized protein LOC117928385 n=1 Tax=Vitis riparia TaxID=96939 RepID=UPI00155A4731|nr:uncharacterized protein LOC117928385 [Vitis riparia]
MKSVLAGKEAIWRADMVVRRFFYDACTPTNVVNSFYFKPMLDAISAISLGYIVKNAANLFLLFDEVIEWDIGKMDHVAELVRRALKVTNFVYNQISYMMINDFDRASTAVEGVAPNMMQFGPATTIVREVLTESNYENWSTCLKWYLVGQDLWEVCQTKDNIPNKEQHPEAFSVWEKKNAMALHAIHISCSGEMLSQIREEPCASYLWDFLQKRAKPTFCFDPKVSGIDERSPAASASTGISVNVDHASDWVQINVVDDIGQGRDDRNDSKKGLDQLIHGLVSYPQKLPGIKNIHDQKLRHAQAIKLLGSICIELRNMKVDVLGFQVNQAVFQAVKRGNVEFVTEMIKSIPELAWSRDINGRNIFFIAILNRQEKIFNLLHGLTDAQKMKVISPLDRFGNSMLHLVAMLAPSEQLDGIPGAALQMQRELQWYKEVESIVPPLFKDLINSDGKKASKLFSQQHADLVKEGEKWMKEIATASSFVAALIVTIMFAAAFTIPGGNNDKGAPIFLDDTFFVFFILSDSISLFFATTSVLMFLGILTSQYAENKFLTGLPNKLIFGLYLLFISIAAMMIAFCFAIAILLKNSSIKGVMIPIIFPLASVPVITFALLQFSLPVDIFISTYRPGIFDRNVQRLY